jgi:hypothetical protein
MLSAWHGLPAEARLIMAALCLALLTLQTAPAAAELYKSIGADGKVRYSDSPPPNDTKVQVLKVPKDAAPPREQSPEAELRKSEWQGQLAKHRQAKEQRRQEELAAERRQQRCDQALRRYQRATESPAIVANDRSGNWNNFSERADRINSAKADARAACDGVYSGY